MDRVVAYQIVCRVLEKYRQQEFADLVPLIGKNTSEDFHESGGPLYTVEVNVSWQNARCESLVVLGRIDDSNTFHFSSLEEKIAIPKPPSD